MCVCLRVHVCACVHRHCQLAVSSHSRHTHTQPYTHAHPDSCSYPTIPTTLPPSSTPPSLVAPAECHKHCSAGQAAIVNVLKPQKKSEFRSRRFSSSPHLIVCFAIARSKPCHLPTDLMTPLNTPPALLNCLELKKTICNCVSHASSNAFSHALFNFPDSQYE